MIGQLVELDCAEYRAARDSSVADLITTDASIAGAPKRKEGGGIPGGGMGGMGDMDF